jgi:outer membrane protein assembly factor BamE
MRLAFLIAGSLLVAGCQLVYKIDVQQGNYVTQETAARLKAGMTKVEVKQLLGSPLLSDVFHANRWDYYFSNVKGGRPEDRTRLSIYFVDEKVVEWKGETRPNPPAPTGPSLPPSR